MAAKRKLNIPTYDHQVAPEGTVLIDENTIDAEVLDDDPTLGERLRSGFARAADARAAARAEDPRAQHKARERQQRAEARQAADEQARLQREAQTDPLVKLRLDTARAGEDYMQSLRRSGILDAGVTKQQQREQLSGMHQIYARMMVLQCVGPLQQGLTSENVVSTLGMAASMWMLSPTFRVQIGNFAANIGEVIRSKIAERGEKKDDKARSRFEKLAAKGKGDKLANKWQRRLDRIEHAERGHRLPFTAQSAAMTEVALAEAAYADMRRPGADTAQVHDRYQSALSALYGYVENDGIEREEVSRSMRVIVGQRLEKEPGLANVFAELGHGRFVRAEPNPKNTPSWTGEFVDMYEARRIVSGSFRVRPPMDTTEHRALATETLAAEMVQAKSPEELNDVLSQYVVATSVGHHPDVIDQIEDAGALRRFGKARTMFRSMADDGLSSEDQQFAYGAAYVDALEVLQAARPDLGSAWLAQYGEDWREKVAEDLQRYNDMGVAAEQAKAHRQGTKAPKQRFRSRTSSAPRPTDRDAEHARTEDIVDAELVDDQVFEATAEATAPASEHGSSPAPRRLEEMVFSADSLEDEQEDPEIIEGEVVDDLELRAADARKAILGGATSTVSEETSDGPSTAAKIKRARVNQSYNEVDTGSITGFGSDDAQPLQDPDFELG